MTSRDFCFWLQGFFELGEAGGSRVPLDWAQAEVIKKHLAMVFRHEIDPSMGPALHQAELDAIHAPKENVATIHDTSPKWDPNHSNPTFRC